MSTKNKNLNFQSIEADLCQLRRRDETKEKKKTLKNSKNLKFQSIEAELCQLKRRDETKEKKNFEEF